MKTTIVKSSWIRLHPTLRMDAHFWILVSEALTKRDINPDTATSAQVKAVILEVERDLESNVEKSTALRSKAQRLQREARELEQVTPTRKPKAVKKTARETLIEKLHPSRFTSMSDKMAAIVGCIIDKSYTQPAIEALCITSDGCFLAQHVGDIGFNDFMGAASDLERNWNALLDAADLTTNERKLADQMFQQKVQRF